MHIAQALKLARDSGVERLDAQLLLAHVLQRPRAWLMAHDDEALSTDQTAQLQRLIRRRADGEPLAYVVGETEFRGLRLYVTPDVLVPRPETEVLVEWALALLPAVGQRWVLDLGTGSGAIALAIQQARPPAEVHASDSSAAALAVAKANTTRHQLELHFAQGDWWSPWQGQRFDVVVANPPYVPGDDPHLAALQHEPRQALTPEGDGLAALRHIIQGAPPHLAPGGWLLLEHGHDQGAAVQALLNEAGFEDIATRHDLAGLPRCSGGRRPRPPSPA